MNMNSLTIFILTSVILGVLKGILKFSIKILIICIIVAALSCYIFPPLVDIILNLVLG